MNKREAAIVSAYTGDLIGKFSDMHEYVEEILHRPVWTHEFASESVISEIHEKSKEDFIGINVLSDEDEKEIMHSIRYKERLIGEKTAKEKLKKDVIHPIMDEIMDYCKDVNCKKCIEEECVLFRIEKIIEYWRMKNE